MPPFFARIHASRRLPSGTPLTGAAILAILAILVPSCALDPDGDRGRETAPDRRGTSEMVMEIRVTDDTSITFFTGEDGAIAVSETAPGNAPSPLNYLVGAKKATPLEIFYSVADGAVEAPAALLADHVKRVAALDGTSEARSAQPRRLSLPKLGSSEVSSLAGCNAGNCDEGTNWYYSADCSLAADGQTYFDNKWASWGFSYHWYKSLYADQIGLPYGKPEQSPTLYYDMFFTHLCNYTVDDFPMNHYVYWGNASQWMSAAVSQGYRHVLHLFNASGGTYTSAGSPHSGATGNFKIGVMAGN